MKRFFLLFMCVALLLPTVLAETLLVKRCPSCGWEIGSGQETVDFTRVQFCGNCGSGVQEIAEDATPILQAEIGDVIRFGHYEQDNNLSNGAEEIEWIVLHKTEDRILVISRYALDCKPYNTNFKSITWENSTLRAWLNDDFLNAAFSSKEQAMIPEATVIARKNPDYDTDPGNNTLDKIFPLSIFETEKYFSSDRDRQCKPTAYAQAQGAYTDSDGFGRFWLRTPGYLREYAASVREDGDVSEGGYGVSISSGAIRPAMWISLTEEAATEVAESTTLQAEIGDVIRFGHYEQDGDLSNGAEEIEWIVLDKKEDQILVISQYILDYYQFTASTVNIPWADSPLRQWLNDDFLNVAFTKAAQKWILPENISTNSMGTAFSRDQIFLLTMEDASYYFSDTEMIGVATPYYFQQAGFWSNVNEEFWWMRPLDDEDDLTAANLVGSFAGYWRNQIHEYDGNGLRPAMWISLTGDTEMAADAPAVNEKRFAFQTEIGDIITFGHYEQDGKNYNGQEAIEWIVLDKKEDRILVISQYALDCKPYNKTKTNVTWETCTLRAWLNDDFLNAAFSYAEQSGIFAATVAAHKNPEYSTNPGNDTQDKVFLLSVPEAEQYFSSDSARKCKPTVYATNQGAYTGICWWWLRSPGSNQSYAADVYDGGAITDSTIISSSVAVRPAMWIKLEP